MIRRIYPLFFIGLFFACSDAGVQNKDQPLADTLQPAPPAADSAQANAASDTLRTDNPYNNITAVLAGQKGGAHDLNYLFDTLAWARHAVFIDSSWTRLEKKRLGAMKEWGRTELAQANSEATTVFYPFSGPDFLTAHAFFPNADHYIMLGLEPVGKLPDLAGFKAGEAAGYAADFQQSLADIFDKSYFITSRMLNDFRSQKVNGLLPVLAFFIQKSGGQLLDVRYLLRYEQDSISEVPYTFSDPTRKPFGVRVDFAQDGRQRSVYYFKYDVSNKLFNDTNIFYRYIDAHTQNSITYIKSASYLLHAGFMSNMRDLILRNSTAIIQDDTGIPYAHFEKAGEYETKLYGQYTRPVKDFPYLNLQKPLQEAFQRDSSHVGQLPFHLGYHWGSRKDIIIYAQRRKKT